MHSDTLLTKLIWLEEDLRMRAVSLEELYTATDWSAEINDAKAEVYRTVAQELSALIKQIRDEGVW